LLDVLIELSGEALLGLAGPAARAARQRWRERGASDGDLRGTLPELSETASATITRVLARRGFGQGVTIALSKFLSTPEGMLLARYIAVNVLTDGSAKAERGILVQATALLRLCPATSALEEADLASNVVQVLNAAIQISFAELERRKPDAAASLRSIAYAEYSGDLLRHLQQIGRDLTDLRGYDPALILAEVDQYCASVASSFSLLSIPSLQEERRVALSDMYVEPAVIAGAAPEEGGTGGVAQGSQLTSLLGQSSHWVVLGDPGGGKSTLLKATAQFLAAQFAQTQAAAFPIFVSLARYARTRDDGKGDLLTFIQATLTAGLFPGLDLPALRYMCSTGRVILFLDGFDEILSVPKRAQVRDDIEALAYRFPAVAMVVSSRSIGYGEAPLNAGKFNTLRILRFDESRIGQFAQAFFSLQEADEHLAPRFMNDSSSVLDIRSNPLMLGLLCILYQNDRTIPANRAELYRSCADLLFSKWDSRRGIEPKVGDAEVAEDAVSEIALKVFESGNDEIAESSLRNDLETFYARERGSGYSACRSFAEEVLNLWRGRRWLLISVGTREGEEHFVFAHRTFLEYFAALQTVYKFPRIDVLWPVLAPYVESRSGVVYAQLVSQMFSRRAVGAGDELLSRLVAEAKDWSPGLRWNSAVFASELLPGLRANASARAEACHLIVDVLCLLVPLQDSYPKSGDVYKDILEEAGETPSQPVAPVRRALYGPEYEDEAREELSFGRLTLPLQNIARAPDILRSVLLGAVEARLLWHIHNNWGPARAQGIKLAFQMPVLRYAETWRELDQGRGIAFEAWANLMWASCRAELETDNCEVGLDYWLDVYLAREGVITVSSLFDRRGPAALMLGGWGLPLLAPPPSGTCLHVLAQYAILEALDGKDASDCAEIGPRTLAVVKKALGSANWLETEEISALFSASPDSLRKVLKGIDSLPLLEWSEESRFGLTCIFLALGLMGDYTPVEDLGRLTGDTAVRALVQIVNASRYTGEIPEAREMASRIYGSEKASLLFS
jgi:hypothetical protein